MNIEVSFMKKYFSNISLSILFLFIATLLFSLILAILSHTNVISLDTTQIIIMIMSFIVFFTFGLIFGRKVQKKGLLNGLVLVLLYGLTLLVYYLLENKEWTLNTTIVNGCRALLILIGSVIGVNTKKKLE